MRCGTANFKTVLHLKKYYKVYYGFSDEEIDEKLARGECSVGKPRTRDGEVLTLDADGRYHVEW